MVKNGGVASIFTSKGTSIAFTDEAMTRVGSTPEFYITARTSPTDKSWWDPAHVPTFKIGGVTTVPIEIDYAAGMATFAAYTTGAVTVSGYYFVPKWLGGGYGFDVSPKTDKIDVTTFPGELNTVTFWKAYVASLLDWSGNINRHYWYGRSWQLALTGASGLIWAWKSYGTLGDNEALVYVSGVSLGIVRASNVTTVTYVTGVTKASDVKTFLEADPTLAALWELEFPTGYTGSGYLSTLAHTHCQGGRDYSSDIARLATDVLVRFYLDVRSASLEILSGIAMIEGIPEDCKLNSVIESDITLQGKSRLKYHTV